MPPTDGELVKCTYKWVRHPRRLLFSVYLFSKTSRPRQPQPDLYSIRDDTCKRAWNRDAVDRCPRWRSVNTPSLEHFFSFSLANSRLSLAFYRPLLHLEYIREYSVAYGAKLYLSSYLYFFVERTYITK